MSAPLDPEIAAIVAAQAARGAPRAFAGGIAAARARFRAAILAVPVDPAVQAMAEARDMPEAPVPSRLYTPAAPRNDAVIVWFHGGGYALGNLDLFDETARRLSGGTGSRVVAIGYPQAPEHPFPQPFDAALAATRWVVTNAAALGADPRQVIVGGESSGGNLAASAAIGMRDAGVPLLAQLLVVPGVNLARRLPDDATYPMLTAADLADIRDNLCPPGTVLDACPPSPLHAADLSRLAPAVIALAGHDPLQPEGAAYAERLREAGVPVVALQFDALHHQFFGFAGASAGAARAFATICEALAGLVLTLCLDDQEKTR